MADISDETRVLRSAIERRAIVMEVGGFRPPSDPAASWFGRVCLALPGEHWPESQGKPMLPLCQVNLVQLPFSPPHLDGLEFFTVFIDQEGLPTDKPNGEGWCLRAYRSLDRLVPMSAPEEFDRPRPFPMRPRVLESDHPCWEDVPVALPPAIADRFHDLFENSDGTKLGGWPSLIQSEIFWGPGNQHPASPEFVFQIDSEPKAHWNWGHGGVGYFGRGTAAGFEDTWVMAWQCH